MHPRPRRLSPVLLFSLLPIAGWFVVRSLMEPYPRFPGLYASFGLSILALVSTLYLIPALGPIFVQANLKGKDQLKSYDDPIPESMGLVCASIYILLLTVFIPVPFSSPFTKPNGKHGSPRVAEFPHQLLAAYLSSLLSLLMATILGFLDDLFDIRWRHKLPIPIISSIPVLVVYYAERGNTNVVVPRPLRPLLGTIVNLGPLYYVYMSLLSTFCTNSINILAGINGSEVSQALIIAISVILNDLLYLPWPFKLHLPAHLLGSRSEVKVVWQSGIPQVNQVLLERHLLSIYFMLPLVAVCAAFLYHNWYPARVFPGDTLCYVCGMAFAVVGIQAHISKTLLLFFMPQIFNFVLSCPQLFALVPCPRHRLPRIDHDTKLLYPSTVKFPHPPLKRTTLTLRALAALGLTDVKMHPTTGYITEANNLTILNFFLLRLGPMNEKRLAQILIYCQIAGSVLGFVVRYGLAGLVYDGYGTVRFTVL